MQVESQSWPLAGAVAVTVALVVAMAVSVSEAEARLVNLQLIGNNCKWLVNNLTRLNR